ncbi:MAG: tetratricopeptide repeat protein, partial [Kibdelosporangium sp.]
AELGTDPSRTLQDLHRRILAADPDLTATSAKAAAQPVVVPRQLPGAPAPFVGRHDELDRLDAALRDAAGAAATVVISAIAGAGGMGKTWLALHWAHRHADRFPDGQLFVDLHGFSPDSTPMEPAVAVRGFLDALEVQPGRIPVALHAQAALFRSLVAGKRMLLVLDNAANTAQVIPLLPGSATCTVVVTSRNQLLGLVTGHAAHHLPLDVLSDSEARALLVDRLGPAQVDADPAAVQDLIRLCGGFPLALSIIAGQAGTRRRLSLTDLARELHDAGLHDSGLGEAGLGALDDPDPTASLSTVLSWSHHALTSREALVFALLGIAPGPDIGLPAAVSLTGLSYHETRSTLRALEQASLISHDTGGRYRMHDLIRRFATDTANRDLTASVRESALRRVLDFFVHTAYTADRLLSPHRSLIQLAPSGGRPHPLPDITAAIAWFDTEHAGLLAAQHVAETHNWHQTVWELAWSLDTFHTRRGHRHDDLASWQAAVSAVGHLPDPAAHTLTYRLTGTSYADLGRHGEAIEHLNKAVLVAERHQDLTNQARAHEALAWAWDRQGDSHKALEHATHSLRLHRDVGNPVWEADALNTVGWYTARLGDHDQARAHCLAALTLYRRHHDADGEAATEDSLGYIDYQTGHHAEAIEHYEQARAVRRDLGDAYKEADTLDRLGHPHAALGQQDQAHAVWREALELYRAQQRDEDADRVRRQLGELTS